MENNELIVNRPESKDKLLVRRPYQMPVLREFGDIRELTKSGDYRGGDMDAPGYTPTTF